MSEEGVAEAAATAVTAGGESSASHQSAPEQGSASSPAEATANQALSDPAQIQAYQPNYKFKYLDADGKTRQEKEFDEWLRPHIKDADTEKKVRELYERAHGLDYTKSARDKFRSESETLRGEINQTKQGLNTLSQFVQRGDMQSFFEALKIPEDKVLKYALDRINYRELPPEKRAEYDQMRGTSQKAEFLQEQNRMLAEQVQQATVKQGLQEVDRALGDPSVTQIAQSYDARVGQPGAFKREVIARGAYYEGVLKQNITVDQAVKEVLALIGGSQAPSANQVSNQVPAPGAALPGSQTPEKKPMIPNIQGRGTSPARKIPKSIKDLKQLAREAS